LEAPIQPGHAPHLPRERANDADSLKKACENVLCWLRTDKVFVYFMRLKMRALECAVF
jgi:hypothetical protein